MQLPLLEQLDTRMALNKEEDACIYHHHHRQKDQLLHPEYRNKTI